MLRALMRSLRATTTRVASTTWAATLAFGLLRSTQVATNGPATCFTVTPRCTAATTVRRTAFRAAVSRISNLVIIELVGVY